MNYMDKYNYWLRDSFFDEDTKAELQGIAGDEQEIKERFYKNLEFGTAGLRGIIGAGDNRMNIYTVSKATQGFANYLLHQAYGSGKTAAAMGVCIAYDCRRMSPEFAKQAALVLNGNGIKAYLFDELRPTPELSFAVRYLGCAGGIVITASHNPAAYNGYKVYGEDGAQIPFPRDEEIITYVNQVEDFSAIKIADGAEAAANGLLEMIGEEIDNAYMEKVLAQSIHRDVIKETADSFNIVYTPLHGTGNKPVRRVLYEAGFQNVHVVAEQELPDSEFSTVAYPNPEDPKAFELAIKLGEQTNADIIVGTDPDADRVGAVVKDLSGSYTVLSGNMTGALLTDYIITSRREKGLLPENAAVISTIVSTDMAKKIAADNGVTYIEVLTGFKYIGEKIKEFETTGDHEFLFGFEESYGCLAGTYARDKDAVVATMLICEMAAYYKSKNMTLSQAVDGLYDKYGCYREHVESITLAGIDGSEKIKTIMAEMRRNPPKAIAGSKVCHIYDYAASIHKDLYVNADAPITLPKANVLYYITEDESWACVRPSGTEPKIKIYFGAKGGEKEEADIRLQALTKDVMAIIENLAC